MRLALISDIHGNLSALEAVVAHLRAQAPDAVLSLGDQVGLGPCPREVLALLAAEGIPCLLGNHEQRLRDLRAGTNPALVTEQCYATARWTDRQLAGLALDFPLTRRFATPAGTLLCMHAAPQDCFARVPPGDPGALSELLAACDAPVAAFGHAHIGFLHRQGDQLGIAVGSVGLSENRAPHTAAYTLLDATPGGWTVLPQVVPYDTAPLYAQIQRGGMAAACPIMARIAHQAMLTNTLVLMDYLAVAHACAQERGLPGSDNEAWYAAAHRFPWLDPSLSCEAYWGL